MTRRAVVAGAFIGLLASVYLANYLVEHVGIVHVWPTDLLAPAGVYMAGVAFLFRDTVQRLASVQLALLGIAAGAALSWVISPTLAAASQAAAAAVDSVVFLWVAFHSLAFFQGQFVAKVSVLALAYPVVYGWRKVTVPGGAV